MDEYLLTTPTTPKLSYDELCRKRRSIEKDIDIQEQHLADAARQLVAPRNIVKTISEVVFDNVTSGFSLFDIFNRGWSRLRMAMRLIKRIT